MTRFFTDPELWAIGTLLVICLASCAGVLWIDRQEIKDIAHDWLPPTRRR